ncbi:uncharacterized protein LOC106666309 [Cimex lectularius]|uniref:Uncharacterized protein n=1 Tax=Cimex lectularius TaxID=79782 RepID=A0A8I6RRN6_CIMLE|nr:uncharacterized protein LOC106666309 [Cimex lectularius]
MRSLSPKNSKTLLSLVRESPHRVMKLIPHFRIFTSWAKPACQILACVTVLVAMVEMNIDILRHEIPDYLAKRSSLIGYAYPNSIYFVISFIIMLQWAIMAIRTCFTLLKETPSISVLSIFVISKVIVIIICIADIIIILVQYSARMDRKILALGLSWTSFKIVLCMVYMVALVTLHQLVIRNSEKQELHSSEASAQSVNSQLVIYIPLHGENSPSQVSQALSKASYISAIRKIIHNNIELTK